jgi:hypothetical protein
MSAVAISPHPSYVAGRDSTEGLPLEVLAYVFSYLSCRVAMLSLPYVNRKWHDLVMLGDVPWTISPPKCRKRRQTGDCQKAFGRGNLRLSSFDATPHGKPSLCSVHHAARIGRFERTTIAFVFGSLPPTRFLMQCIESMQKLKRIQMPTRLERPMANGEFLRSQDLYDAIPPTNITHLAVTHVTCILSVCHFTQLTSLLISFGVLDPDQSMNAVESCIQDAVEDANILPRLQHLGLHQHSTPERQIATDTIAELVRMRSRLITLSLTGMFRFKQADVRKLVHPDCGLRSLAIDVGGVRYYDGWVDDILNAPQVSLVVLCRYESGQMYRHEFIHRGMLVGGFERLRDRAVYIEGQNPYIAQPFRRAGMDVVWGLTAGALFAE